MLKQKTIESLREARLVVSDTPNYPAKHVTWPDGYTVVKPVTVDGNGYEFSEPWFEDEQGKETKFYSPVIRIWNQHGKTYLEVCEFAPGPGAGDFKECFETEESALLRVIDYYFDPSENKYTPWHEHQDKIAKFYGEQDS